MLEKALYENGIRLNSLQLSQLEGFLQQLNQWNKAYNLTAITDPKEQVYKHIIDSLSIRDFLQGDQICDVGTGAGLPGIPLAIALPQKHFTLIDSSQKRIIFIQQTLLKLGISNIMARHMRIEDYQPERLFDAIVSRAFSSINEFINKTRHLVSEKSQLLAMKGLYPEEELTEIPQDFCLKDVRELTLSGLDAKRHVVILQKR